MTEPAFDPRAIVAILDQHRVEYVLVGGYAANIHGAVRPTKDIDVTPSTTYDASAEALRGMKMLNLRTTHGDMDLTFVPAGFPAGYDDLIGQARPRVIDGVTVQIASLADIITSKSEAGRQKDLLALPELRRLAAASDQQAAGTSEAP